MRYRMYVDMPSTNDVLSAVAGDAENETRIESTQSFYKSMLNMEVTPNSLNPAFYTIFPELTYDSWVTIGISQAANLDGGESAVDLATSSDWQSAFLAGNDIVLNGEYGDSWFVTWNEIGGVATNGIAGEKIEVVHPVPAALQRPRAMAVSEVPEVLFVGQVIRGKGVDLMLKALSCLMGEWQATIVGEGNHLESCKQLAEQLGISERVRFAGWVPHAQLDEYYRSARMLVVPSRWPEPFGMVGIEAMARGRPVVAFANGGIPDWLDHEHTGFLVAEADLSGMASAIQALLDDVALADRMGRAGSEHVQKSFSHKVYLNQIKQHMDQIR